MGTNGRWPDYVIVGAMKAGTTTLHDWLARHPGVSAPQEKEPNFFSHDQNQVATRRYRNGFGGAGALMTGEASTSYSADHTCAHVAARMKSAVPDVRILYLVREPVERVRSHYRHEVRRNREQQPFGSAVTASSPYVSASCYGARIQPFVEHFGSHVLVVPSAQLFGQSIAAWCEVLAFLGLDPMDKPTAALNVGDAAPSFTRAGRLMWESGALRLAARIPGPLRRRLRPIAVGRSPRQEQLERTASHPLPADAAAVITADAALLRQSLIDMNQRPSLWPTWLA